MRSILHGRLFKNKRIVTLLVLLFFYVVQLQAQQQVITFIDHQVRTAILEQYGEGEQGIGNGARQINSTDIDFSKLFLISDPANAGVNGVTSLIVYPTGGLGALSGVELLPRLSELTVSGYSGLLIPPGFENLPLKTLDLSSNIITSLPANFSYLTALESLNISQNALTSLPLLPSGLVHLVADHNQLSFQDLEQYAAAFSTPLDYGEQISFISSPQIIDLAAGQTLSATAAGWVGGLNNRYQWFKEEQAVTAISADPSFTIPAVVAGNAGAYTWQATNTLLEGLVIKGGTVTVSVVPSPLLESDQFWGMTSKTGAAAGGSIFSMNASTNAVVTVKSLTATDGIFPHGDLMQASDGFFYGMTYLGGTNNKGTIFRIYKDGTQFQKVYDFENTLGSHPRGTLVEAADGHLYGMTERGPDEVLTGTVFRINKGTVADYTHLYEFPFHALPLGNLIQADDGDLYGMTQIGAVDGENRGSIFKIKTDGSAFKVVHQFTETKLEGHQPNGSLIQASNGSLYGMTVHGGENAEGDGGGTLFRMETDGRGFKVLLKLVDGAKGNLIQGTDGNLYGMAQGGSWNTYGYIFKTDLNGTQLLTLHVFDELEGAYPSGSLTEAPNGEMYGVTLSGGANDKGVLFKLRPDGSNYIKLHDFDVNGHAPAGSLLFARKINQTITFARMADKQITDGPFVVTASSTSGLAVTLTSSDPAVATISGNLVTILAIGTTTITASQEGDTNFDPAKNVIRVLHVTGVKQNQTISFNALEAKTATDENFELTAFSDSGLPISYESSDESVATIYGNTVNIRSAGAITITASQAGNDVYFGALEMTQQLVINKAEQLIAFTTLPFKNTRSASFTLNGVASSALPVSYSSSNPGVAIVNGATVTILGAGSTIITAQQTGNGIYHPASVVEQELVVTKADQAIDFNSIDAKLMEDNAFTLAAVSDSYLEVTYTTADDEVSIHGSVVTLLKPGSVTITAHQPGDANFNAAADVKQTFCILPATPVITASFADPDVPVLISGSSTGNQWYLNGTLIDTATDATYVVRQQGQYTLRVTIESCSSILSAPSVVLVTALEKTDNTSVLSAYPNPAQESITLAMEIPAGQHFQIAIYNSAGKLMQSGGNELLNRPIAIDHYKAGIYVATISAGDNVSSHRFVKR